MDKVLFADLYKLHQNKEYIKLLIYLKDADQITIDLIMNEIFKSGNIYASKLIIGTLKYKMNFKNKYYLYNAALSGNLELVKYLLSFRVPIYKTIYAAASSGNLELVEYLIPLDILADYNLAIEWAANSGHLDIILYLETLGGRIGNNAFILAVKNGYSDIVRYSRLISNDALEWSSINGHFDIVKYLLINGIDARADNSISLRWAVKYGHLEIAKLLLNNGADPNVKYGLFEAAYNGYIDCVKLLAENGAYDKEALNNTSNAEIKKYLLKDDRYKE